ncbi:hypothetical protein GCM10010129_52250 [Streptomyces fumigatiscleroticus]|nr:hypothetical protein GCM10010129_52250 [Streptomyces fumigatiscleroticus]
MGPADEASVTAAYCRRQVRVPQPCQMQGSATVNEGAPRLGLRLPQHVPNRQVSGMIPQPLS